MPTQYGLAPEISVNGGSRKVKVSVDNQRCKRYGICQAESPDLFQLLDDGRLHYVGQVSNGLGEAALRELADRLRPLRQPDSPFAQPVPRQHSRHAEWVRPALVAEVSFRSWTAERRLRQPSWRGLRDGRDPAEVRLPA